MHVYYKLKNFQTLPSLANHGICSLGLAIQSFIANALDENNFALMASLNLSAAFDVVNMNLLLKRLDIIGIPSSVVSLLETWFIDWQNDTMTWRWLGKNPFVNTLHRLKGRHRSVNACDFHDVDFWRSKQRGQKI